MAILDKLKPINPPKHVGPTPVVGRDARGRLLPGAATLNPRGRPASHPDLIRAAQAGGMIAVQCWVYLAEMWMRQQVNDATDLEAMAREKIKAADMLKATELLVNRGYGAPVQPTADLTPRTETEGDLDLSKCTPEDFLALRRIQQRATAGSDRAIAGEVASPSAPTEPQTDPGAGGPEAPERTGDHAGNESAGDPGPEPR